MSEEHLMGLSMSDMFLATMGWEVPWLSGYKECPAVILKFYDW
jgi:hypothetical protein